MSFKDKLIKQQKTSSYSTTGNNASNGEPREYYPKSIGIYCEDNPKVERRGIRPHVIGKNPPTHKPMNVVFKDNTMGATPVWFGKLFAEPVVVNLGYYPHNALYEGTDDKIFPNNGNDFDKKIPILNDIGIDIPLKYELLTPVVNERKRLSQILTKKLSEKGRASVEKSLAELNSMKDDEKIRTRHDVKILSKVFIPVMMAIVIEEIDEEGELVTKYDPKLVIFEETMGIKKAKALVSSGVLDEASNTLGMMEYLYGDIDTPEAVGQPIMLFRNSLGSEGQGALPPLAAQMYEDKIPKALMPFFEVGDGPQLDEQSLLRLIILEMIQLFAPKGDTSSIEGKIKEHFWNQVQKEND